EMQPMLAQYPLGFGQWLQALAYAFSKPREIAIVGDPEGADTQALLRIARDGYRPYQVVALALSSSELPAVTLLQDRGLVDGRAAAYVCRDFACQAPVMRPGALRHLLDRK
ncbi:MAG: thioredoxin domain-containing protein, partial [Anaerolineae bacterium]